jgi:hypothetical protein
MVAPLKMENKTVVYSTLMADLSADGSETAVAEWGPHEVLAETALAITGVLKKTSKMRLTEIAGVWVGLHWLFQ